ncbi:MAG TPA: hypothetical protein VD887_11360 [Allosphingosinicella sp.]|nr:hypothetical protein [Allosphingosinicella sp.]
MKASRTCPSPTCGARIEAIAPVCPKCGEAMPAGRARGWLLLGLGLFLVVFMGAIAATVGGPLLHAGAEVDGTTFTGTADQAQTVIQLFGAVILFGAVTAAYGTYMIVTGRQSRFFLIASLLLFGLLGLLCLTIMEWKG